MRKKHQSNKNNTSLVLLVIGDLQSCICGNLVAREYCQLQY